MLDLRNLLQEFNSLMKKQQQSLKTPPNSSATSNSSSSRGASSSAVLTNEPVEDEEVARMYAFMLSPTEIDLY